MYCATRSHAKHLCRLRVCTLVCPSPGNRSSGSFISSSFKLLADTDFNLRHIVTAPLVAIQARKSAIVQVIQSTPGERYDVFESGGFFRQWRVTPMTKRMTFQKSALAGARLFTLSRCTARYWRRFAGHAGRFVWSALRLSFPRTSNICGKSFAPRVIINKQFALELDVPIF